MRRSALFLPFGALVLFAGYLGWRESKIPSESDVINHYAARYVAEAADGADVTDCFARPHYGTQVRLVVVCEHPTGAVTRYYVGLHGQLLPEPELPDA